MTYDAVDRAGRGLDGQPIATLPKAPDVITAAFTTDVGVDTEALQIQGGGYLWYDVTGITRARDRTLDEVKDQVAARWRDDEAAQASASQGGRHVGKLKAGTFVEPISPKRSASPSARPRAFSAASRPPTRRPS